MTQRKRLEGALADWHPHPKEPGSLAPVVHDGGVADDIADRFFDSAPPPPAPEPPILVEPAPRRVAIESAAVRARRRYLMRYVAGAVSVAGVIGLAAVVRMTTARDASAAAFPPHGSAAAASLPVETASPLSDDPIAPPDPRTPIAIADPLPDPAVAAVAPAGPGGPANPALDVPMPQEPPPADVSPRAAADAKRDSQRALDRGRLSDAIEAGEESVALDPTDADAWLLLGAAYMQKGRFADARRSFSACVDQARRGDRRECRALLR
jgi:hypothetical protein